MARGRSNPANGSAPRGETETQAARAFQRLRADILQGRLVPNMRLRLDDLRERYSIGFSPIREALSKLQSEGLVVLEEMKGFRVAPVSLDHLYDLTKVRCELESLGLRWSIAQGDVDWEADVISAFHRLSKQPKSDSDRPREIDDRWRRAHSAFHASLVAACGSELLIAMRGTLFDQAERYLALSIRYMEQPRDDNAEHEALMRAVLDRDAETACRLTDEHIRKTTAKVVAAYAFLDKSAVAPEPAALEPKLPIAMQSREAG